MNFGYKGKSLKLKSKTISETGSARWKTAAEDIKDSFYSDNYNIY